MEKRLFFGTDNYGVTFDYDMNNGTGLEIDVNGGDSHFITDEEIQNLIKFLQQLPNHEKETKND